MVVGDTWLDFISVKQHHDFLHFVVDPAGPSEPVTGSVHVNERPQESFLSRINVSNDTTITLPASPADTSFTLYKTGIPSSSGN